MISKRFIALLVAGFSLFIMVFSFTANALKYGAGTYGSCQYSSCSITLSANGTVSLSVTPTSSGVYATVSDDVSVLTGASTGFTLTLSDADTNTSLINGSDSLSSSSGTQASPVSRIMNSWGYRVDNLAGFGSGPTNSESNAASSSYSFAGVPASNQPPHTIRTTTSAADPAVITTVWYGAAVNTSKPAGTYSDVITYTATVND